MRIRLRGRGLASTDVKEVGGRSTSKVKDIHGRHRKSGSVNEASDRAIELDEVEPELRSLDLGGVLLGQVAKSEDVLYQ